MWHERRFGTNGTYIRKMAEITYWLSIAEALNTLPTEVSRNIQNLGTQFIALCCIHCINEVR